MNKLLNKIHTFLVAFGGWAAYGLAFWYLYLFTLAYNIEGKAVILWIDFHGEADLEIFVMAFAFFAMVYSICARILAYYRIRREIQDTIKDVG